MMGATTKMGAKAEPPLSAVASDVMNRRQGFTTTSRSRLHVRLQQS